MFHSVIISLCYLIIQSFACILSCLVFEMHLILIWGNFLYCDDDEDWCYVCGKAGCDPVLKNVYTHDENCDMNLTCPCF